MTAKMLRGLLDGQSRAAVITTKKNKHRCQLSQLAPAGEFHGGSFGVCGTPPVASMRSTVAKPLGSENEFSGAGRTMHLRQQVIIG